MTSPSDSATSTAAGSATSATPAGPAAELRIQRSELLAYGAILPHEVGGLLLGSYSPTRELNLRTGRNWSAWQWQQVLSEHYARIAGPAGDVTD